MRSDGGGLGILLCSRGEESVLQRWEKGAWEGQQRRGWCYGVWRDPVGAGEHFYHWLGEMDIVFVVWFKGETK